MKRTMERQFEIKKGEIQDKINTYIQDEKDKRKSDAQRAQD